MSNAAFSRKQLAFFLGAALVLATLAVFWPVRQCEFINYDDGDYVTENPRVQAGLTGENIQWAFSSKFASNWHPMTWLSHMMDAQMYGLNPKGHHFTNLLLHTANVLLLFLALNRMTAATWRSAIVAGLFALHPLRIESVAWVSERKDVLSGFFFMLTLLAWASYAERQRNKKPAILFYSVALAAFACGLMSKPMLVTAPAILLLLDIWPLRRMQTAAQIVKGKQIQPSESTFDFSKLPVLLIDKVPFLLLALISSQLTITAQKAGGSVRSLEEFPLSLRIDNALIACVRYMRKMFWPNDLAIFYPHPKAFPTWQILGALVLLVVVTVVVVRVARKQTFLAVGWFWFLAMLVPVIGLVQVGIQSMADRYTYLPMIGLYVVIVWAAAEFMGKWKLPPQVLGGSAAAALIACSVATRNNLVYWHDSETLFRHALTVTTDNYVAHENLGIFLANTDRLQESEEHLRIARDTHPTYAESHHNLGNTLHRLGRDGEAIPCYQEAVRLKPDYDAAYNNWGFICAKQGRFDEAKRLYTEAASLKPNDAIVHYNLAAALVQLNKVNEAISEYNRSLELNPTMPQAHFQLARVFAGIGKTAEAISHLQEAVRLKPDYTEAQEQLKVLRQ